MSYIINRYNGTQLVVLEDGTIDTTTSLNLVGRNYVGYGEVQNENYVYLLENFANTIPPIRPISGQTWFNTSNGLLNVYDGGSWQPVGAATVAPEFSGTPSEGSLWFKTPDNQFYIWSSNRWNIIGPESALGYGVTRTQSRVLRATNGQSYPVILFTVDDDIISICSASSFTIVESDRPQGFESLIPGINLSGATKFQGSLAGNADTATKLQSPKQINGVLFDGSANITLKSSTTSPLRSGDYIVGENFDGSSDTTWSIDATSANQIGKIVARNSSGGFSAGTINADLVGNVLGNVTAETGTSRFNIIEATRFIGSVLTGSALTATQLENARLINGVPFDGTRDITVSADASTLTSDTLNFEVLYSNLKQLGTLLSLDVQSQGVTVGDSSEFKLFVNNADTFLKNQLPDRTLNLEVSDPTYLTNSPRIAFMPSTVAQSNGGDLVPTFAKTSIGNVNLGLPSNKWNKIFGNDYNGVNLEIGTISSSLGNNRVTVSADLIVTGDFTVQGNLTTINTSEMTVEDITLTLASGAIDAAAADGAGIIIDTANASMLYSVSGDSWIFNKDVDAGANDFITTGLFRGTATSAQYADLAENYIADKEYDFGTVLEIGGDFEVTIAREDSNSIAGVVSQFPAYLMNSDCQGISVVPVALTGRVKCKVRGTIKKGDLLVSAGNGFAKTSSDPKIGTVIGKSLQDFNDIEGMIEILVGRV